MRKTRFVFASIRLLCFLLLHRRSSAIKASAKLKAWTNFLLNQCSTGIKCLFQDGNCGIHIGIFQILHFFSSQFPHYIQKMRISVLMCMYGNFFSLLLNSRYLLDTFIVGERKKLVISFHV